MVTYFTCCWSKNSWSFFTGISTSLLSAPSRGRTAWSHEQCLRLRETRWSGRVDLAREARLVRQEDALWLAQGGSGPAGVLREAQHRLQKLDLHHRDTRAYHRELPG